MSEQRGWGSGYGSPADVLSHTQLLRQSDRASEVLARLGVRPGDSVPVLLPMSLESVVVTLACLRLSATRITLPLGNHRAFVRQCVNESGATVVVTADACRLDGQTYAAKSVLDRALADCPAVRDVLVIRQLPRPVPWVPGRDRWWHEVLAPLTPLAPLAPPARPYPDSMSDTAQPGPERPDLLARLVFDDPLERRSADDADHGWGERPADDGSVGDLARFISEKPPHHL